MTRIAYDVPAHVRNAPALALVHQLVVALALVHQLVVAHERLARALTLVHQLDLHSRSTIRAIEIDPYGNHGRLAMFAIRAHKGHHALRFKVRHAATSGAVNATAVFSS